MAQITKSTAPGRSGRSWMMTGCAALMVSIGLGGCTGEVTGQDPGQPPVGGPVAPGGGSQVPGSEVPGATAPIGTAVAPFRRMTKVEYKNTVKSLLKLSTLPAVIDEFPPDLESSNSGFVRGGTISEVDLRHLMDATSELSQNFMSRLAEFVPCNPVPADAAAQDACAGQFIQSFGLRAYRRPLTDAEISEYTAFYVQQRTELAQDFPNATRMIVSAMLMSPKFLYRWEVVPERVVRDGDALRFSSYEVASRLSYLLWSSMPDDELFAAAGQGLLGTPEQIEQQARRMLQNPNARDGFADFFSQWLGITQLLDKTKNSGPFPNYSRDVAQAMLDETRQYVGELMLAGDGTLQSLLTSTSSFVNQGLAQVYEVQGVTGDALTQVSLDPTRRSGILTHASFLASHGTTDESHPVQRGKILAERVLCTELLLPPDDIPNPKPPAPNLSTRERFAEHGSNVCAQACHSILDPLGFAFEHYDAIGGYRTMDGGKPVDATGTIKLDGEQQSFTNAIEMTELLAQSEDVRNCMSRQLLRFTLKRHETNSEEAALAPVHQAFAASGYDIRELLVALTTIRSFTHRAATPGEVLP